MLDTSQSPITSGLKLSTASRPVFLVIMIVVIVAAAAGGYWYWSKSRQATPAEEASSLGSQLFEQTQQNPVQGQVPDTNPFQKSVNTFEETNTNPFEDTYTNPFE